MTNTTSNHTFGEALEALRHGHAASLPHWPELGSLRLQLPHASSEMTEPYIYIEGAVTRSPWQASHSELLRQDWIIHRTFVLADLGVPVIVADATGVHVQTFPGAPFGVVWRAANDSSYVMEALTYSEEETRALPQGNYYAAYCRLDGGGIVEQSDWSQPFFRDHTADPIAQ